MKHHEYQIYYGGRKTKLINFIYCTNCHRVTTKQVHRVILMHLKNKSKYHFSLPKIIHVRSHKKQKGKPLSMRNSAYEKLSD